MITNPAQKMIMIFIALFLFVIGVTAAGSYFYKNSSSVTPEITTTVQESPIPTPQKRATLQLNPVAARPNTYSIVISDLDMSLSGLVFQLESSAGGSQIISNTVETISTLESSGWSTAINSTTEEDQSQILSFSMILSSAATEVNIPTLEIGTVTFDQAPSRADITLNAEESYVTYTDNSVAYLNLVVGTETLEN